MCGRKRRRHRHGRHDASERQHGFDALAGGHDLARHAEADGVAEKMAHRPPRRFDRRLASSVRGEPSPMRSGDLAVEIGDSGDHRGPGLGRRIGVWPVVAAGMEAEASGSVQSRNAAVAQIRFHDCARNRLRHGEQSPRGFRGSPGNDDPRSLAATIGSDRGSSRKRLASSTTSRKSARRQLSRMTSRRSPWSPVAASVHLPAAPFPDSAPFSRTKRERPGVLRTSPTSQ